MDEAQLLRTCRKLFLRGHVLDVHIGITVLEAIERINRDLGTLAVIITHNAILADMADRVFTLSDGRIVHARENATRGAVRDLAW